MAFLYIVAGINHFVHTDAYVAIMPRWLPAHRQLVFVSGCVEVLLGGLLLVKPVRRRAAAGIIALLIAVFPANVQMMLNYAAVQHPHLWLTILRLPLQGLLIWWAYRYAKPLKTLLEKPVEPQ